MLWHFMFLYVQTAWLFARTEWLNHFGNRNERSLESHTSWPYFQLHRRIRTFIVSIWLSYQIKKLIHEIYETEHHSLFVLSLSFSFLATLRNLIYFLGRENLIKDLLKFVGKKETRATFFFAFIFVVLSLTLTNILKATHFIECDVGNLTCLNYFKEFSSWKTQHQKSSENIFINKPTKKTMIKSASVVFELRFQTSTAEMIFLLLSN